MTYQKTSDTPECFEKNKDKRNKKYINLLFTNGIYENSSSKIKRPVMIGPIKTGRKALKKTCR